MNVKLIVYKKIVGNNITHGNVTYLKPIIGETGLLELRNYIVEIERLTQGFARPEDIHIDNIILLNID